MTTATVTPREQALARARRALDRARARRDADRAAGRLAPELDLACRRLERQHHHRAAHRAAA